MKKFKKIFFSMIAMIMMVTVGSVFTSCSNDDDFLAQDESSQYEESSVSEENSITTRAGTVPTPVASDFDEVYTVSLTNYTHVYQQGVFGMCGPCSYVSARSIRNPSYPAAYSNASTIKSELDNLYGSGNWGIYQLYARNDGTTKSFSSWPAGNNMWGNKRTLIKNWIKSKISQGKPCVIPCLYNMSTDVNAAGHFYVIVSLYLKDGGTGSVVGVKDVWNNSSSTLYFSYTDLLSSNWMNAQQQSGVGSESYSVMSFEGVFVDFKLGMLRILSVPLYLFVIKG